VSDFKLSGFNPSTGIISFAYLSHDPADFPTFFNGIGKTSFATFSSSLQHVFSQEFVVTLKFWVTGIFVMIGGLVTIGRGVGVVTGGSGLGVVGDGFGVVFFVVGVVTGILGGGVTTLTGIGGGTKTFLPGIWPGGNIGVNSWTKTCGGGSGVSIGITVTSFPLQPSGKKYRMFPLRCSSSLKSPTKEAFLKSEKCYNYSRILDTVVFLNNWIIFLPFSSRFGINCDEIMSVNWPISFNISDILCRIFLSVQDVSITPKTDAVFLGCCVMKVTIFFQFVSIFVLVGANKHGSIFVFIWKSQISVKKVLSNQVIHENFLVIFNFKGRRGFLILLLADISYFSRLP
jgi:hypothetical protein